jgi:hypothetical protein
VGWGRVGQKKSKGNAKGRAKVDLDEVSERVRTPCALT